MQFMSMWICFVELIRQFQENIILSRLINNIKIMSNCYQNRILQTATNQGSVMWVYECGYLSVSMKSFIDLAQKMSNYLMNIMSEYVGVGFLMSLCEREC